MKLKLKHLRHPLRTAKAANALVAERLTMRRLAHRGERRFKEDVRYDLRSVTDGFAARIEDPSDDTALLERICAAYGKAVRQERLAPDIYGATPWWEDIRRANLGPVMHALAAHDVDALRAMYANFFRDPCSTGLIGVPYGMSRPYREIANDRGRLYLIDALYRIDHWRAQTEGRFALRDLAGAGIGNPFGVAMEGSLIESGAEYRHYCAHRVSRLLDSRTAAVAEIGGGFGGMAYYLLRDRPGATYFDFDVPESLALTSYFLMKAFPRSTFLLYGEEGREEASANVTLMPLFQLAAMPAASADVTFSSHAVSGLSPEAMAKYLGDIARITRRHLLYIGGPAFADCIEGGGCFKLAERRWSQWHSHKTPGAREVECLYSAGANI